MPFGASETLVKPSRVVKARAAPCLAPLFPVMRWGVNPITTLFLVVPFLLGYPALSGTRGTRTLHLLSARQTLSQMSYGPVIYEPWT
jgi:uncharacterized membrane protein